MTDEPIPSLAEAMAEIRRLRARILEIEAIITLGHGTMGTLEQPDAPAVITHGHVPSAPPHDKPEISTLLLSELTAKALEAMSQPEPENDDE